MITSTFKNLLTLTMMGGILCTSSVSAEKLSQANSPVMHGFNDTSGYYVYTTQPSGLYSFQASENGDAIRVAGDVEFGDPSMATYSNGKYFLLYEESNWWTGTTTVTVKTYDTDTWEKTGEVSVTGIVPSRSFCVNSEGTKGYAEAMNGTGYETYLNEIDLTTGESKILFEIPGYYYYVGMTFGPDNMIYALETTNHIIRKINLSTGEMTDLGSDSVPNLGGIVSFYYDKHDDCFYAVGRKDYGDYKIARINPYSGEWSIVGTVPEKMNILGAYMPEYADGVPDNVKDVDFSYETPGSQSAHLVFTMPSTTYSGKELKEELTAVITIDGNRKELTSKAGETVKYDIQLENGNHTISIVASNATGDSPARRFHTFTGLDAPSEVENLSFVIDDKGNAHVEWTAPSGSVNGGAVDAESITYKVVRNPNNVVVASDLKETQFEEVLKNAFGHYTYTITPYAEGMEGIPAVTETITWGENNVPPFVETFDDWQDFNRYTTFNPNEDNGGWFNASGSVYTYVSSDQQSDYWLFTPGIELTGSQTYTASFEIRASSWDNKECELEVMLCDAPTLEASKSVLVPKFRYSDGSSRPYVAEYDVRADGIYYLAFHCTTEPGGAQMYIDNISVVPNSEMSAPAGVENLTVSAGEKGALTATLQFEMPLKNYDGTSLSTTSKVEISRFGENEVLASLNDVAAGEKVTWTDENALDGYSIYAVTPYSGETKGLTRHASVTTGFDVPAPLMSFTAKKTADGNTMLEWTAPSEVGVNGGYVNPENVKYTIKRADDIDGYYVPVIASDIEGLTFTDESFVMPEGEDQRIVRYDITAGNEKGTSGATSVYFTQGEAYTVPFTESFANGSYLNDGWGQIANISLGAWSSDKGETTIIQPQDKDKGFLRFTNSGVAEASATLHSPRISLAGKETELSLMMNHGFDVEPEDLTLTINVIADDGTPEPLAELAYCDGTNGWQRHAVSLAQYAEADNVIIELIGRAADSSASIFLDNLKVAVKFDQDLELTGFDVPGVVEIGDAKASITVSNIGKKSSAFSVILYKNDEEVAREEVSDLASGESMSLLMDMNVLRTESAANLNYRAEVTAEEDQDKDNNNSLTLSTIVKYNPFPAVELECENSGNTVSLNWDKPEPLMTGSVADGFEKYSAYALNNFGDWITVDVDGKNTEFSKYWSQITNAKAPMAWEVWNIEQVRNDNFFSGLADEESFIPHSGDAALISFSAIETSGWFGEYSTANDNWLISPEVIGATELSFWMKSHSSYYAEAIELYYTTENIDPSNPDLSQFNLLESYSLMGSDWRKVSEVLPVDAVRFAIRHCTQSNGHIVMLDDFEFTPLTGDLTSITPVGYNIYRNDALLGFTDEESFTDILSEKGLYTYYVSTVWKEGESAASNSVTVELLQSVSVGSFDAAGVKVQVGRGYIEIQSENNSECTVNSIDGSVIFSGSVSGTRRIACKPGVHVVCTNGLTSKIIVR
ncbi:MAG: choice-of-anchor J domain-containing protein [Muribaculum sp.]|nr:choice-of-anchor J domain-containing protein [Muribaculum sp.]